MGVLLRIGLVACVLGVLSGWIAAPDGKAVTGCSSTEALTFGAAPLARSIGAANEKKADVKIACGLFRTYIATEGKMLKALETNGASCGVPTEVLQQVRGSHAKAKQIGKQVCDAAARGPAPSGPTLSDALGTSPTLPSTTEKKGAGTFETLTGNPFQR